MSLRPTGALRSTTSEAAAHQILTSYVTEYMKRYPGMQIDLVKKGRLIDIVAEGFASKQIKAGALFATAWIGRVVTLPLACLTQMAMS